MRAWTLLVALVYYRRSFAPASATGAAPYSATTLSVHKAHTLVSIRNCSPSAYSVFFGKRFMTLPLVYALQDS